MREEAMDLKSSVFYGLQRTHYNWLNNSKQLIFDVESWYSAMFGDFLLLLSNPGICAKSLVRLPGDGFEI
jgi:hypothetical protein